MFLLSRRSQVYTVMTSFCSYPFLLGLLVGITLHLYSRGLGQLGGGGGIERGPEKTREVKQDFLPILNKETKKEEEVKEKTFVRPRFVKVGHSVQEGGR